METILQEKLSIDKTNWTPVKFGDVVFEPKESTKDFKEDGIEHVVGLEHIDSGDIHLKKFATTEETTTFTKMFTIGDVLFGRRRAYLKKAALASFSGVCSGDITVFRANDNLLPELLPFIVNNEKFFDYAIKHSAGGLSPRVKFKDLANYEFLLPPKDQQAKLAELLWAMDEVVQIEENTKSITNDLYRKAIEDSLTGLITWGNCIFEKKNGFIPNKLPEIPVNWKYGNVSDYIWFQEGPGVRTTQFTEDGVKLLNGTNINYNKLNLETTNRHISEKEARGSYSHFLCDEGDLLIACSGITVEKFEEKIAYVGKEHLPLCMNTSTMRFKPLNTELSLDFFKYFLMSQLFKFQIKRLITGSAQLNFGPFHMGKIYLPIPSANEQDYIVNYLNVIRNTISDSETKISSSKALQKSIINQIF